MLDIVYVDDDPYAFMEHAPNDQKDRIAVVQYSADEPDGGDRGGANVWLFDFFLVEPNGGTADENGLSLFQKWRASVGGARPTTILISSDLQRAVGDVLGPVQRHHVLAQRHGVEWIAAKSEEASAETWRQVLELADGAARVGALLKISPEQGKKSGTYDNEQLCFEVLGMPADADWASSAQRQVDRARPPREVSVETSAATARAILGWLISHVLPYPSFLLTDAQAALRLQIVPEDFGALATAVEGGAESDRNRARLAACTYSGPLAGFLGRRWWRAGIDDLAWRLSEAEGGFAAALNLLTGDLPVGHLDGLDEPVLLSDANLVETTEVAEARECVRVADEDFPANVEPAWVRIADVKDNRELFAKVIFEDRDLIETAQP